MVGPKGFRNSLDPCEGHLFQDHQINRWKIPKGNPVRRHLHICGLVLGLQPCDLPKPGWPQVGRVVKNLLVRKPIAITETLQEELSRRGGVVVFSGKNLLEANFLKLQRSTTQT